jgi:hypothetical protein
MLGHDEEDDNDGAQRRPPVDLARETVFTTPQKLAAKHAEPPANNQPAVVTAVHEEPVATKDAPPAAPITADGSPSAPQPLRQ